MDNTKKDFVTIITLNYNQTKMTIECVNSLLKSTYKNFLVILIDNGSTNENYQILFNEFKGNIQILLIRIENNVGYVKGVNRGLEESKILNAEYIQIMNNDTIIDKDAITELVNACKRYDNKAIVSGKVYHFDRPDTLQYIGHYYKKKKYLNAYKNIQPGKDCIDIGEFDIEKERDMLDDIYWLFHKNLINDIGLYNTAFFLYAEQADFALRAVQFGYKLIYTPKAKLWHKGSITTGDGNKQSPKIVYWRSKGTTILTFLHIKRFDFILTILYRVFKIFVLYIVDGFKMKNKYLHHKASIIGMKDGLLWVFNRHDDTGYNPFN